MMSDAFSDRLEDVSTCLWMALRDVHEWAEAEQRHRMFGERNHRRKARLLRTRQLVPDIAPALETFLCLRSQPEAVGRLGVAAACYCVWNWAESESLFETAAHFAEAAAYLDPDNPAYANDAGWACRRCARYDRALAWYQRGFRLAVRARSRHETIRALLGHGTVFKDLGQVRQASVFYDRASRRAARTGRRRQAAVARHYIFALEAEFGSFEIGLAEARETLNLYPIYDRRVPYLAHDYAFMLIRHRHYSPALPLLEKIFRAITKPEERLLVQSSIAWAAAAAGRHDQHRQAEKYVLDAADAYPEYAVAGLIHLAHAARLLDRWEDAAAYAMRAGAIAASRREVALVAEVSALAASIHARVPGEPEAVSENAYTLETLGKMFTIRLRRWLAPDRRGTGASKRTPRVDRERMRL